MPPASSRKPLVAGNWKMYTTAAAARDLASAVVRGVGKEERVLVAVCPPFPYLGVVAEELRGSPVLLGAQNLYPKDVGAFTGEVSPAMLKDVGCHCVILGHSERRQVLGETDDFINQKVKAALAAGLRVILCVGETLPERDASQHHAVVTRQLRQNLAGLSGGDLAPVCVAYEPVWAIGTGRTATPGQAQEVHDIIRRHLAGAFGEAVAQALPVLYGGSVKPDNAAELMRQPDVDGALVGGASLKADQFLPIVRAALV